jgi:hypothetical protein
MKKWLLVLLVITIYLLHQDYWNWKKTEPLVFGFLPIGLAYHAGYSVLAAFMMWLLVRFAWPKELDDMERETPPRSADAESASGSQAGAVK